LFNNARLTGAIFSKANLENSHLNGGYLKGAILGDANLKGAYYNNSTQFSSSFDPNKAGAIEVLSESHNVTITISQLLDIFNAAFQTSCKYLGNKISIHYPVTLSPFLLIAVGVIDVSRGLLKPN
jgi:Pentapeptide repeats (8 copies)